VSDYKELLLFNGDYRGSSSNHKHRINLVVIIIPDQFIMPLLKLKQ